MCLKPVIVIVALAVCVHRSLCSDGPAQEDQATRTAIVDRMKEMVQSIAGGGSEYSGSAPESIGGGGGRPDAGTTTIPAPQYGVSPDADVCVCHDYETC